MKKIILKIIGILGLSLIMMLNINIIDSSRPNNTIGINVLAAAIAATCEADNGDECICKGKCWADVEGCGCF